MQMLNLPRAPEVLVLSTLGCDVVGNPGVAYRWEHHSEIRC